MGYEPNGNDPNVSRIPDWSPPGHYYSPIVNLNDVRGKHSQVFDRSKNTIPGVDLRRLEQLALLDTLEKYYPELPFPENPQAGNRYYLKNEWFSHSDATCLYLMMRNLRPKRIIEVGSGFSSSAILDVAERFIPEIELTFIDPDTARLFSLIHKKDLGNIHVISENIQNIDIERFGILESNDILFIDSSHVVKTASDVNFLVLDVLPMLRSGVRVHFHDIFFPFEYPEQWVYEGWAWNEAYLLRSFLMYNQAFQIELFPSMLQYQHASVLSNRMPLLMQSPASSLWLRRI